MSTKKALSLCHYCPSLCRSACPVADADRDEASTPQAKMTTMKLLAERKIPWTKEAALQAYKCSHCGHSTTKCELDNPVAPVLDIFRSKAFERDMAPATIYAFCRKFKRRNNPYDVDLSSVLHKKLPVKYFAPQGLTYFPGCTEIRHNFAAIKKTISLMEKLRLERIRLFDQPIQCCGYPLIMAGDVKGFREHADVMRHMLEDHPVLISGAPACVFTFKHLYPAHGFKLKTQPLTLSRFLQQCLEERNFHLKRDVKTRAAYHDPCYEGRYLQEYDAPRSVLRMVTGDDPQEFRRCRENSYCCGGGGLLPLSRPETAKQITRNRLQEFRETGADTLVTSCPTCVHRFRHYGSGESVKSLVEFIDNVIEPEARSRRGKTHK